MHLYKQDKILHSYQCLKKKQVLWIGTLTTLSVIMLCVGLYDANTKVIIYHQQVMEEFSQASDPNLFLIEHTVTPSTLVDLSEKIKEVKTGKVHAATYPWKSTVFVVFESEQQKVTMAFTYVRFYDSWKLDGIYDESIVKFSK
ncbi:hypothetical protein [Lysinibacillus fusiformis]